MPNFDKFTGNGMGSGFPPVTGFTFARTFVAAWLTAIAAVFILPVILVVGIAMGVARQIVARKGARSVILEGEYRVLGPEAQKAL